MSRKIIPLPRDRLFAALLLRSTEVELAFWVWPRHAGALELVPYRDGEFEYLEKFDSPEGRDVALEKMATAIAQLPDPVERLGIATYGPLYSVMQGHPKYGTISNNTVHKNLRGFSVFGFMAKVLAERNCSCPIVVHTDVMCGAIHEAYARSGKLRPANVREHTMDRVLAFLHIADGVGGGAVAGNRPHLSALHPEIGFLPAQIIKGDKWAEGLRPSGRLVSVGIERLISVPGLLDRVGDSRGGDRSLRNLTSGHWELAAKYIAQLCASVTVVLAPHQIVLHGPVIYEAYDSEKHQPIDLVKMTREFFGVWLNGDIGPMLEYDDINAPRFIDSPLIAGVGAEGPDPMLMGAAYLAAQTDVEGRLI